jgi:hypothetical protein
MQGTTCDASAACVQPRSAQPSEPQGPQPLHKATHSPHANKPAVPLTQPLATLDMCVLRTARQLLATTDSIAYSSLSAYTAVHMSHAALRLATVPQKALARQAGSSHHKAASQPFGFKCKLAPKRSSFSRRQTVLLLLLLRYHCDSIHKCSCACSQAIITHPQPYRQPLKQSQNTHTHTHISKQAATLLATQTANDHMRGVSAAACTVSRLDC